MDNLTVIFVLLTMILVLSDLEVLALILSPLDVKTIILLFIDSTSLHKISLSILISLDLALVDNVIGSFPIPTDLLLLPEISKFAMILVYFLLMIQKTLLYHAHETIVMMFVLVIYKTVLDVTEKKIVMNV